MAARSRRPEADDQEEESWRGYVPHGSEAHASLLGLDDENLTPERREQLEKTLKTKPVANPGLARKLPVTRENYAPDDRYGRGDPIIDGWTRRGR